MTQYTTVTLLPLTVYGTPSGNYDGSSATFVGNAVPAANYYGGQGSLQTLNYTVAGLDAVITVEATLTDLPDSAAWFQIDSYGTANGNVTGTRANTVIGNFSWLRAVVTDFTAGNITAVTASY